jgi:HJR/Mrr/RecB family endonuclease
MIKIKMNIFFIECCYKNINVATKIRECKKQFSHLIFFNKTLHFEL